MRHILNVLTTLRFIVQRTKRSTPIQLRARPWQRSVIVNMVSLAALPLSTLPHYFSMLGAKPKRRTGMHKAWAWACAWACTWA